MFTVEYCPVIWSCAAEKHLKKILRCSFRANVYVMHRRLSWLSVEDKLKCYFLLFMHNVIWNNTLHFLCENLVYAAFCHDHVTRQVSTGHLVVPVPHTKKNENWAHSAWNKLAFSIRLTKRRRSFKYLLEKNLDESHLDNQ